MRRAKTARVPRTRAGNEWTEASFWAFVRSLLRAGSRRWPPIARHVWNRYRRPSQSENKRLKWEFWCSGCDEWFPRNELQVDHVDPCGTLKSWEDLPGFASRLFCEVDGLTLLCEGCHKDKTQGGGNG